MTKSEQGEGVTGERLVGPWQQTKRDDQRWVRLIVGDSAGDHAALVSFGAGDTWWRVYRADEPQRAHAEGDVDDIEAGKAAADSHLEAAGWTIGTVATSAADGHFTTNETTEWDELSKPEAGLRAAINRDRWLKMGLNGARYFEPGFAHSADRENYLLNEHERLTEVINGARQALDECGAPTHTPHGRLLGLGGRVFAMFEQSLVEPVKPVTRPKVSGFHQRGAGGYVVDDHGEEVGGVWPEGKSGEWAWYARRALLPSASALDAATKDEAQAACLEVLRTWADVDGEPARALSVGEVFAAASGPGESGSLVGEGSTGPLRKAWNEWCRLSAEPIRTDAQEAECRFWRCLLDEAGIETWDAVPREEIPPCPGDIDGQRVTDLRDPTPPAPVAARPRVSGWVKGSDNFWSVYGATGAEVASVWKATEGWCLNVRRAFLPPVEDSHLSSEAAAKEAALAVLRTWADVEGEQGPRVLQEGGPGEVVATTPAPDGTEVQDAVAAHVVRITHSPNSDGPPPWWGKTEGRSVDHSPVPTPPEGFAGTRVRTIGEAMDGAHVVRLALYRFADGSEVPYLEANEVHDGARPGRVMSLSAAVHLLQNATEAEVWAIGAREAPKAIEPAGPLSLLVAVGMCAEQVDIAKGGPWGAIDETPFAPGGPGLWMWSGRAEAERDEQVGGWDFTGEWTALPLPVLP